QEEDPRPQRRPAVRPAGAGGRRRRRRVTRCEIDAGRHPAVRRHARHLRRHLPGDRAGLLGGERPGQALAPPPPAVLRLQRQVRRQPAAEAPRTLPQLRRPALGRNDPMTRLEQDVQEALGSVADPELDRSLVELGFARAALDADGHVTVEVRLPTYWCAPNFAYLMVQDARDAVAAVPGVRSVSVRLL